MAWSIKQVSRLEGDQRENTYADPVEPSAGHHPSASGGVGLARLREEWHPNRPRGPGILRTVIEVRAVSYTHLTLPTKA